MSRTEIEVHATKNFSDKEKAKFMLAIDKAEDAINSKEFERRVMGYNFDQTNGDSNYAIYLKFMGGADRYNPKKDGDLDVYITMYYSWGRAIGYTMPSTYFTWINRKFFSGFNHASIAGNVVHEYCHNLGYDHRRASDHDSVPYAIGYIVRDMIIELEAYGRYLTRDEADVTKPEVKPPKLSVWGRLKKFLKRLF
jgi:hypothetical protein